MKNLIPIIETAIKNTTFWGPITQRETPASDILQQFANIDNSYEHHKLTKSIGFNLENIRISGKNLENLISEIRENLAEFISKKSGKIGLGDQNYSLEEFAKLTINATVTEGSNKIRDLLWNWKNDGPINYSEYAKLKNIKVTQPLSLEDGIKLFPENKQTITLAKNFNSQNTTDTDTILEIKRQIYPSLNNPDNKTSHQNNCVNRKFNKFTIHSICEMLSLVHNNPIEPIVSWLKYETLQEPSSPITVSQVPDEKTDLSFLQDLSLLSNETSQEKFEQASNLLVNRIKISKNVLDVAISRWIESKRFSVKIQDNCINLRIALEALVLPADPYKGELKFRLATYYAWFLGQDFCERKRIFDDIKAFYDLASSFVHGSTKEVEKASAILSMAQIYHRQAIIVQSDTCVRVIRKHVNTLNHL